ncbi:MAG: hypothetical protein LBM87_06465 [Ruminococcus sp.]|jgi:hypothetical protein|nr:hypothetical protein [Ruminococcus sp.]
MKIKNSNQVRTHKTEAIMKMLLSGSSSINPTINSVFKDDVIRPLHDRKSQPQEPKPQVTPAYHLYENEKEKVSRHVPVVRGTTVDIIRELIDETLPTAIKRFRTCECSNCYKAISEAVAAKYPDLKVKINSDADLSRVEYIKSQNRNNVLRVTVTEVLKRKNDKKHIPSKF